MALSAVSSSSPFHVPSSVDVLTMFPVDESSVKRTYLSNALRQMVAHEVRKVFWSSTVADRTGSSADSGNRG